MSNQQEMNQCQRCGCCIGDIDDGVCDSCAADLNNEKNREHEEYCDRMREVE